MFSLSQNLQNHTRSFLNFRELHASRPVCKQWADIESVPKTLDVVNPDRIPPYACFSRITHFRIRRSEPKLIFAVFHESQNNLKSMEISTNKQCPKGFYIPKFDALQSLKVNAPQTFVRGIFNNAPNLVCLNVPFADYGDYDIDLSLFPKLRELAVKNETVKITNLEKCQLRNLRIHNVTDVDKVIHMLKIPHLEIRMDCYSEANGWLFDLISTSKVLKLVWVCDFIEDADDNVQDFFEDAVTAFKNTVTKIKSIRDTPLTIQDEDNNVARILEKASFLSKTGLLEGKALFQTVAQFSDRI